MARALVVDDDRLLRFAVAGMLEAEGHEVEVAGSGREGIDLGVRWRPDWVVTDWMLADALHGLHVAGAMQAVRPDVAAVLITGFPLEDLEETARELGVSAVLQKPFEADDLLRALREPAPSGRRRPSPGFGVIEVDAAWRVVWSNPDGARWFAGCGPPEGLDGPVHAWHVLGGDPGCEVRVRDPWPGGGTRLVVVRPIGGHTNDALADMILGLHDPGTGRWPSAGRVLVVDDQRVVRVMARTLLERAGATCYTAGTHEAALRYLAEDPGIEVVLLDFEMPDGDVSRLIEPARSLRPDLVMIGNSGGDNRAAFANRGVERYLPKPWRLGELLAEVTRSPPGR